MKDFDPIKKMLFRNMKELGYLPALLSINDATPELERFEQLCDMFELNILVYADGIRSQEEGQDDAEDNTDNRLVLAFFSGFILCFVFGFIFCLHMVFLLKLFK